MLLQIDHQELKPGTALISLQGSVMRGPEGEQIETVLNDLLDRGYHNIIFDLSGVKRIDSTGIGRFIASLNKVQERGGKLRMAAAEGYVRECFRVTRLDTIFRFCPSVEEAAAGLT